LAQDQETHAMGAVSSAVCASNGSTCCGHGLSNRIGRSDEEPPVEQMKSSADDAIIQQVALPATASAPSRMRDSRKEEAVFIVGSARDSLITPRGNGGGEFHPEPSPRSPDINGKSADSEYEGEYNGSKMHGYGRLRASDSVYEGCFVNDLKHGEGTLFWNDGRQYIGSFEHGRFSGDAIMRWPDGRMYRGQYFDDRKHGVGTFTWKDGRSYEGEWVRGQRHGTGLYTNAKGLMRVGHWEGDRPISWEAPLPAEEEAARRAALVMRPPPIPTADTDVI